MGDADYVWTMREFPRWEYYHWYARALRLAGEEGRARALDKEAVQRAVYQSLDRQMPYAGLPFKDHTYQAVWSSLAECPSRHGEGEGEAQEQEREEGLDAHWPVPKSVLYRNLVGDVCGEEFLQLQAEVLSFYEQSGPLSALAHTEQLDSLHGRVAGGGAWRTSLLDVFMHGHRAALTGLCLPAKAPSHGTKPHPLDMLPSGMPLLCDVIQYHRPVLNQYEGGVSVLLLAPGSSMAPHCEGLHGALRLLLPVRVRTGAELVVGLEVLQLNEGVPVVFDPTVVHSLSNAVPPTDTHTDTDNDDEEEQEDVMDAFVVFDVMHPSNARWHPRTGLWQRMGYNPQQHRSTGERRERREARGKAAKAHDEL
jgi:hypothetical protein